MFSWLICQSGIMARRRHCPRAPRRHLFRPLGSFWHPSWTALHTQLYKTPSVLLQYHTSNCAWLDQTIGRGDYHAIPYNHHQWLWCLLQIVNAAKQLKPITFNYIHIRGHQDRCRQQWLTLQPRLNIECDKHASQYLTIAHTKKPQLNLELPSCYPHLCIAGSTIVWNMHDSLCHAATTPDYHKYMQ